MVRRRGFELSEEIDDAFGLIVEKELGDLRGRGVLDLREGRNGFLGGDGIVLADELAKLTASVDDSRQKLWYVNELALEDLHLKQFHSEDGFSSLENSSEFISSMQDLWCHTSHWSQQMPAVDQVTGSSQVPQG